jgi:hypothetical protein
LRRMFTEGGYYAELGERMRSTDDIAQATDWFLNEFEKPAVRNLEHRVAKAYELRDQIEAGNVAGIDVACDGIGPS